MFLGVVLVVIGIVLILKALGLVTGGMWTIFWGILFLIIGAKIISKKQQHCFHCDWLGYHHKHAEEHKEKV